MTITVSIILIVLFSLVSAGIAGYVALTRGRQDGIEFEQERLRSLNQTAEETAARLKANAETEIQQLRLAAKEEESQSRRKFDSEQNSRRKDLDKIDVRLQSKKESLDKRSKQLDDRNKKLDQRHSTLDSRAAELDQIEEKFLAELEHVSGLSQDEARAMLLEEVEKNSRIEMSRKIREVENEVMDRADRRAREIITLAIERVASDHISEYAVTTVSLPSDEMKGRIIGRQGRNIRAIEQAIGVDLVVDDTPEAIIVSSFDPVRREVARMALTKLVADGRIHPTRIEKEVEKAQQEIDLVIREAGEQALLETGTQGLHREIQRLLGRLKFRTSYGQNQLNHAVETAHIAAIIASELHANVKIARLGGLLHDIGKAVSHEVEGPHAIVGGEIAKRYGINEQVVNCIASHHNEVDPQSIEAVIVAAADAISGARPGARREGIETYIKRISALEEIGNSFNGVEQTYAIQAGREIRVVVQPEDVDDLAAIELSKNIAQKIEDNMEYPGQIRVTVVRETRSVEYAK